MADSPDVKKAVVSPGQAGPLQEIADTAAKTAGLGAYLPMASLSACGVIFAIVGYLIHDSRMENRRALEFVYQSVEESHNETKEVRSSFIADLKSEFRKVVESNQKMEQEMVTLTRELRNTRAMASQMPGTSNRMNPGQYPTMGMPASPAKGSPKPLEKNP